MRTRISRKPGFPTVALTLALLLALPRPAIAGGPLAVGGPAFGVEGAPFTWDTATEIQYNTDNGLLSAQAGDDEVSARNRVIGLFNVWENVGTAAIGYNRAGFIAAVTGFGGGDVNTGPELTALEDDCLADPTPQSFIVYDADGQIFDDLAVDTISVIGFAGPCSINSAGRILGGEAVMNGLFTDGVTNPGAAIPNPADISDAEFDAAFIHEFGHFSGLDHSQINVNCLGACSADDLAGVPTMFPFLLDASMGSLSVDDIAWISRLYPSATFSTTHGTITGTVFFTDTESHAQGVNVIARPLDAGGNEDRTSAVSVVSGFRFTVDQGNSILGGTGSDFGSRTPAHIGLFEIPVPAGTYTIDVEAIDSMFEGGSSVGPLSPPIPMPGTSPGPSGNIVVAAGATVANNNVTLVNTDPRFDQFEGP